MSTPITLTSYPTITVDPERAHRRRFYICAALAVALVLALAAYGFDYYLLSAAERPFSPKHHLLKPSGIIGIKLGIFGLGLFLLIFLYALRKRIGWLSRRGKARHWLDFHVIFGLTAPVIIAFHASFKFQGIAGMAFWIMFAVALSGIVGRYIYAQIPRSLNSAELSLKELESMEDELARDLADQHLVPAAYLEPMLRMPSAAEVRDMPAYRAMLLMFALDLARPFHIARLRIRVLGFGSTVACLGGLLRSSNAELERAIVSARRKSALSKRIVFLSRTQQVFHLWHVIHRPFSYSFAVLAAIHIIVVMSLGFL
jgi:hypothetical protein